MGKNVFSSSPCVSHENKPPQLMTYFQTLWHLTLMGIKETFLLKKRNVSVQTCAVFRVKIRRAHFERQRQKDRVALMKRQQQGSTHQNSVLCLVCFDLQFDSLPQWQLHLPPHRVPHALWAQKMGENRHIQLWKWKKYSCRADYGALLNILYLQVMEEHKYGLEKKKVNK